MHNDDIYDGFYKAVRVVRPDNAHVPIRVSALVGRDYGHMYEVRYDQGKWAYPHSRISNSGLMVFDALDRAKYFGRGPRDRRMEVWRCKVMGPIMQDPAVSYTLNALNKWWSIFNSYTDATKYRGWEDKKARYLAALPPIGTCMVRAVMLTKLMWSSRPHPEGS